MGILADILNAMRSEKNSDKDAEEVIKALADEGSSDADKIAEKMGQLNETKKGRDSISPKVDNLPPIDMSKLQKTDKTEDKDER